MHILDTKTHTHRTQHSIRTYWYYYSVTQFKHFPTCYCFPILEDNLLPFNCCTTITLCISLVILRLLCYTYFHSIKWRLQRTVDDVTTFCWNYLCSFYEVCSLVCFQNPHGGTVSVKWPDSIGLRVGIEMIQTAPLFLPTWCTNKQFRIIRIRRRETFSNTVLVSISCC